MVLAVIASARAVRRSSASVSSSGALAVALMVLGCQVIGMRPARGADRVGCEYELLEYSPSPDGKGLAELVSERNAPGGSEWIVYSGLDQGKARWTFLFHGSAISELTWLNAETVAFVENRSGGHLITEDVRDQHISRVVNAAGPILEFLPDAGGKRILYAFLQIPRPGKWTSKAVPDGLGVTAVALPSWAVSTDFGSGYSEERTTVAVWSKGRRAALYSTSLNISLLAWLGRSPRQSPAVLRTTSERSPWDRTLVDLSTDASVVGSRRLAFISLVAASRSGSLAIVSPGPPGGLFESTEPARLYVRRESGDLTVVPLDPALGKRLAWISRMWWMGQRTLLAEIEEADHPGGPEDHRLVEIDVKSGEVVKSIGWPSGSLDDCRVNRNETIAICQADELTVAGQLVKVDLSSGNVQRLAPPLSPCIRKLQISFREITVRNRDGGVSTGFLALPDRRAGGDASDTAGIPLAIMLYGFGRTFAADGQWVRAYPVARLVSAGIGVLLLNFPRAGSWRRGDAAAARRQLLEGPVSTVKEAPAAVAATGVRVGRVLVMGWSWGGFVAAHVIEESCRFVAAEVGDPASYNVASYALNNATWRDYANALFGGPPDARYIKNYMAFDPESSGAPPKGPILLEFVSRNLDAGQYLEEWRAAGAYVEAFAYHFSPHALSVPAEAKISRERNLLWAELNLLPKHRPAPADLSAAGLTVPPKSAYRCR